MSDSIYGIRAFTTRPAPDSSVDLIGDSPRWRYVTLMHNGGGLVSVGENQNVQPASGGLGFQLMTGVVVNLLVPPNKKLYIAASVASQAVSVCITEIPEALVAFLAGRR